MSLILIVDDMPIFRDPIAASLRVAGYDTARASNGLEALRLVRQRRPALVLLDLVMPEMDGITFLRELRSDPQLRRTPVIVVTARCEKRLVVETMKLGVQDYLLKASFTLDELLARVGKYANCAVGRDDVSDGVTTSGGTAKHPRTTAAGTTAAVAKESARSVRTVSAGMPAPRASTAAPSAPPTPTSTTGEVAAETPTALSREQCLARAEKAMAAKTLSGAVAEVVALSASPRGTVSDLAPLIARDPMLSARVLQVANSAAYASSRPVVRTIPDAVRQIGMATVRSIASALGVFEAMPASSADGFNPVRCWQHSFAVAMLCERLLPRDCPLAADAGILYLVGLCHDLGETLFHTHFGREYGRVLALHELGGRPLDKLEREMMGMTRGELVQTIVQRMGLPDAIKEPIRCFHDDGGGAFPGARPPVSPATRVLRVAELYANGLLLATSGRSPVAPLTRAECKAAFGQDEIAPPDPAMLRSEVFYTTGVLARLSDEEARDLMQPQYERTAARVCVVRERSLSPLDPVTAALEAVATVTVVDRVDAVEVEQCDGVVVMSPSDATVGFTGHELARLARPVLWLVGRTSGGMPHPPDLTPRPWPVRLDDLIQFARQCASGGAATARAPLAAA